jgi:hypothetical protein
VRRHPDNYIARGDVAQDDGIGPDDRIVPDPYAAENRCSCANHNTGAQLRVVVFQV